MKFFKDNRGVGKGTIFLVIVAIAAAAFFGVVAPELKRKMEVKDRENIKKLDAAISMCVTNKQASEELLTGKSGVLTQFTVEEMYFTADGSKDTPHYVFLREQLGDDFDQRLLTTKKDIIVVIKGYPWIYEYAIYADVVDEAHQLAPKMNYKFYEMEDAEGAESTTTE